MKRFLFIFAVVLFAADVQRASKDEELEILRLRTKAQQAQAVMREAEQLWKAQNAILCGEGQKPGECLGGAAAAADAAFNKLKASYAAKNLDLAYDLSLKPAKPAAEASKK